MNYFVTALCVLLLSWFFVTTTYSAETTTIANGRVVVADVEALLAAAKKKQVVKVVKTSLWNEFEYPPILVELAKQNDITVDELVQILAEEYDGEWNPYFALQQLDSVFASLPPQVSHDAASELLTLVTDAITREINKSLEEET